MFIEAKDDGGGGDNWTTGAISRAKLQSNHHHQQTNIQFFTDRMPFLSPNQQCQSTGWKNIAFHGLSYPKLTWGGLPTLYLITNSSWLPWGGLPCLSSAFWCQYPKNKKLSYHWQTARRVYRSVKVPKHGTIPYVRYSFRLVWCSNFVHRFLRFSTSKMPWPWKRVRDPWRSLKMSPFDRKPITFYWCSIVTMTLSCAFCEIFNIEKYHDLEIPVKSQSRSLTVVPFDRLGTVSY